MMAVIVPPPTIFVIVSHLSVLLKIEVPLFPPGKQIYEFYLLLLLFWITLQTLEIIVYTCDGRRSKMVY